MNEKKLLMVDDDTEFGNLIRDYLEREGYQVTLCATGEAGLEEARKGNHALVLLDVMLPGLDGFEVLRALRRTAPGPEPVPVIMLTARGEEIDRIVGLEMGADDYLPKPFNPRELSARIKAVLRRAQVEENTGGGASTSMNTGAGGASGAAAGPKEDDPLILGELKVDLAGYQALLNGQALDLTPVEFILLKELALSAGRVQTRETLLDKVRGKELELFDRSIDVHVSHLRQKLGDPPNQPKFIKTVRGVGYLFIPQ